MTVCSAQARSAYDLLQPHIDSYGNGGADARDSVSPNGGMPCAMQVWWRAQAAAYIIRPNEPTMAAITALRMNTSLAHVWQAGSLQANMTVPYPMTPGTISMHVRRELCSMWEPWSESCLAC